MICSVVGVWGVVMFVLYVMRVVGGVPSWADVVYLCLLCTQLLF